MARTDCSAIASRRVVYESSILVRFDSCSADHRGQPGGLIVTQGRQSLKLHVSALQLALVVLLEPQRADQAYDGGVVGEDSDDVGLTLDLGVEPLEGIGAVDLRSVRLRERHERQHFDFSSVHELSELRQLGAQLIGDDPPLRAHGLEGVLCERGVDRGEHHLLLPFAGVCERVAQEVNLAALPGGVQDLGCGGLQARVGVGDDELDPSKATACHGAQEVPPERLRFAWTDSQTKHLTHALSVYGDGNYYGLRHDPAGLLRLHVDRIDPRPVALDGPIEERVDAFVDLPAQPADLALRDPGHPHCLDQLVDRTGRDAPDISG